PRIIDIARLIPVYHTGMIRAENADPATKYVKRFDFLAKGERLFKKNNYSKMSSREIRMCEILMTDPHPNVCTYHGVTLDENGVISGLVFDKYQTTLWDLITQGVVFDTKKCMNDIQKGISHLHNNDMVHCDIKPENILAEKIEHGPLKGSYHFVVGDFDSTHFTGTKLTLKGGTHGWSLSRYTEAWPENDYYGLSMIRYWLEKKGWSREKVKPVAVDTTWIL
ncbi:kinase-like domain-containing protein, partial [Dendryphion nanum]